MTHGQQALFPRLGAPADTFSEVCTRSSAGHWLHPSSPQNLNTSPSDWWNYSRACQRGYAGTPDAKTLSCSQPHPTIFTKSPFFMRTLCLRKTPGNWHVILFAAESNTNLWTTMTYFESLSNGTSV